MAYLSGGAEDGTCTDPNYPIRVPRILIEVYWDTVSWADKWDQAMNTTQPFVYAYGDRTGYGLHADFINGWESGVLQKAINGCNCDVYGGSPQCCSDAGIFTFVDGSGASCSIPSQIDETVEGTMDKLPGNNPVVEEGGVGKMLMEENPPEVISGNYVKKRVFHSRIVGGETVYF